MKTSLLMTIFLSLMLNTSYSRALSKIKTSSFVEDKSHIDTINLKAATLFNARLKKLNQQTPIDLVYNKKVDNYINNYLGRDAKLIQRMQTLKDLYFPIFESILDKYNLPLELKYLAIVESSLNPRAKSPSGATGLWQFMYLTGKQYNLNVTSFLDERQDPYKSTEAACKYFTKLYDMFGDWHLVLAAYNGGPGYLQRKINIVGSYNFWDLYPHLRSETRNYIPKFIAINYIMSYSSEHKIYADKDFFEIASTDTLKLKKQVSFKVLSEISCVNEDLISYLNPSYKKHVIPKNYSIVIPSTAKADFLNNQESNHNFISAVDNKEILIDEERIEYITQKGDYLGKIAKSFNVRVFEIKKWNNLNTSNIGIGERLVVYVKNNTNQKETQTNNMYLVKKGDTLWDIAQKYNGISIWKIKALNNMENDKLKPGTKLILPNIL